MFERSGILMYFSKFYLIFNFGSEERGSRLKMAKRYIWKGVKIMVFQQIIPLPLFAFTLNLTITFILSTVAERAHPAIPIRRHHNSHQCPSSTPGIPFPGIPTPHQAFRLRQCTTTRAPTAEDIQ